MHSETEIDTFSFDVVASGEYTISVWVMENEESSEIVAYSQYQFTVSGLVTVEDRINEILSECTVTT